MNEKIKEFLKKYLIGFIIGVITTFSISVIAATYFPSKDVTYDNGVSGLKSKNVQDAIDELYTDCTTIPTGEQIIEDAGLEKDFYECRYFFTGENPNNYITFNGEKAGWRIISVECDGTIKIMINENIENMEWDTSGSNNWARPATINTYLNETYFNMLNDTAQSQIVVKDFSIGGTINHDLADIVNDENEMTWKGKIALPTLSEYLRTNSSESCKTYSNNATCKDTTWMYYSYDNWWLLTYPSNGTGGAFRIGSSGVINTYSVSGSSNRVRPTLYLNSNVKLSGSGTESDPYVLS